MMEHYRPYTQSGRSVKGILLIGSLLAQCPGHYQWFWCTTGGIWFLPQREVCRIQICSHSFRTQNESQTDQENKLSNNQGYGCDSICKFLQLQKAGEHIKVPSRPFDERLLRDLGLEGWESQKGVDGEITKDGICSDIHRSRKVLGLGNRKRAISFCKLEFLRFTQVEQNFYRRHPRASICN